MITSFLCLTAQCSTLHPLICLLKPDLTLYVEDNYCRGIKLVTKTCNHQSYYTIVTRRIKALNFDTLLRPLGTQAYGPGGGGGGGAAVSPNFGQLRFFGQQETFGQSQFLKKFSST